MGISVSFSGLPENTSGKISATSYSVQEQSTPLTGGDSSGGVGTFQVTIPTPDRSIHVGRKSPWRSIRLFGPEILTGASCRIYDDRKGFTLGTVEAVSQSRDGGMITVNGRSKLSSLSVYGIQAQPFSGTLRNAFSYYMGLAGVTSNFVVDSTIANRQVVFPGWYGELWYHLKQAAMSLDCDLSLVSGVILLRPIHTRYATTDRDTERTVGQDVGTLAQSVEIYRYDNKPITNQQVYPPGGWSPDATVFNVNAGETTNYTLQLSASVSSITQPTMVASVDLGNTGASAYSVITEDNTPIDPAVWRANGGMVTFTIGQDTKTIEMVMRGPTGVFGESGQESKNFAIAMLHPALGTRVTTLSITGTGVAFNREKITLPTGVPASRTGTVVGVTVDNPFISTWEEFYRIGYRVARAYAGPQLYLSGNLTAINKRGDTGQASFMSYKQVQDEVRARIGMSATYDQEATYMAGLGYTTYLQVENFWKALAGNEDKDQVFGNIQGTRIWDKISRRFYRVRSGTSTPSGIAIERADDDLMWSDVQTLRAAQTYNTVQGYLGKFTYDQAETLGGYVE